MGLEVPELDDRTFEELLEDARKRIPVHTEEWTDYNVHDPGITILELLAWVAESDLYRLDQITDSHLQKFLALLDARPRPPKPATARLRLEPHPGVVGQTIPTGEPLAVEDVTGAVRTFETDAPVTLTDASVAAVVTDHGHGRTDNTIANRSDGMYFLALGERAERGSSMYVGFEGDPFMGGILELAAKFHTRNLPAPASHGEEEPTFEPSVEVAWEYCTNYDGWYRDVNWENLRVLRDETRQLYQGGTVRLERPENWNPDPAEILDHPRPLRWIRCTVAKAGHEIPPQLDTLYVNAVTATHRSTVTNEQLSRVGGGEVTTARPGQVFTFEHAPVLEATVTVGGDRWKLVDDFDGSGPADNHYVLDQAAGQIRFGDEVRGAVPEPGLRVVANRYVHGGGAAGNVSPAATWTFRDRFRDVGIASQSVSGGRDAETIDEARAGLRRDADTPYRAVTADDYRYVATNTPGLRFGRATAVVEAATRPADERAACEPHKEVRVVVVPFSTRDRPQPSEGFVDAVRCHVQTHRLLTDRVTVEPPRYVGVGVRTEIGLRSGYAESERIAAIEEALDAFLHPLNGFDGDGWPFGRRVYLSELYEVIAGVEGIDCVFDVSVSPSGERGIDSEGNVLVGKTGLVTPTDHDVTVRREYGDCRGES